MKMYNLTAQQYEETVNVGRLVILAYLFNQGIISEEVYREYALNHAIIIKQASFFNKLWETIYKDGKERYILIKQKTLSDEIDEDPDDGEEENIPDLKVVPFNKS